jgi:hypothetical protein
VLIRMAALRACSSCVVLCVCQVAYNVTINFPNVLRQSCLVVISTYW